MFPPYSFSNKVPTLDGRVLRLPCPEVVSPGYERRLGGEGMPVSKSPGSRGDLLIRFKLVFPAFLPQASKVPITTGFLGCFCACFGSSYLYRAQHVFSGQQRKFICWLYRRVLELFLNAFRPKSLPKRKTPPYNR